MENLNEESILVLTGEVTNINIPPMTCISNEEENIPELTGEGTNIKTSPKASVSNEENISMWTGEAVNTKTPLKTCISKERDLYRGEIMKISFKSGIIAFERNGNIEKAGFKKQHVILDGQKVSDTVHLEHILKVGMPVLIDVVDKLFGYDLKYLAMVVKVSTNQDDTQNITKLSYSENPKDHYLGNLMYCGKITNISTSGINGAIVFQKDGVIQKAGFNRDCVIFNGEKISNTVPLRDVLKVGMPVRLNALSRIFGRDFNYSATVVEAYSSDNLISQDGSDLRMSVGSYNNLISEVSYASKHLYGTPTNKHFSGSLMYWGKITHISTSCNDSGAIIFQNEGGIQKAGFKKENVIFDGEKISDKVALGDVLKVGMPVCLNAVSRKFGQDFSYSATLVEASSNVYAAPFPPVECSDSSFGHGGFDMNDSEVSCNGLVPQPSNVLARHWLGTHSSKYLSGEFMYCGKITNISANGSSGAIMFQNEGGIQKAGFKKTCVIFDGKKISDKVALGDVLKVGMSVCLNAVSRKFGEDFNYAATAVEGSSTVDSTLFPPTSFNDAYGHDYYGVIKSVNSFRGLVSFPLNGVTERAYFHRQNVFVDEHEVSPTLQLLDILRCGMSVSLRVVPSNDGTDIRFIAVFVNVSSLESFNTVFQTQIPNFGDNCFDKGSATINLNSINEQIYWKDYTIPTIYNTDENFPRELHIESNKSPELATLLLEPNMPQSKLDLTPEQWLEEFF